MAEKFSIVKIGRTTIVTQSIGDKVEMNLFLNRHIDYYLMGNIIVLKTSLFSKDIRIAYDSIEDKLNSVDAEDYVSKIATLGYFNPEA